MILKSRHHFVVYPFFKWYSVWATRRNFTKVNVIGSFNDRGLPILLISNHSTWWDGFWAMYLNVKVFSRKFHFMMLESQLRRFWFFNLSGGFSVKKGARSMLESLHYASDLLADSRNLVLMFPQGIITSSHAQEIIFQKGVERILEDVKGKVQIVFQVNYTDYLSSKKPSLYMYLEEYEQNSYSFSELQHAYNRFYHRVSDQQSKLRE